MPKREILLLNLFLAECAATWATFVAASIYYPGGAGSVVAGWFCLLGCCFSGLFALFVAKRRQAARAASFCPLAWAAATLLLSNFLLGRYYDARLTLDGVFDFDPTVGWHPRGGLRDRQVHCKLGTYAVTTNSLGYRDPVPYPPDGEIPVMVQGDSNAFGFGLQPGELLCDALNRLSGTEKFHNFGVSGYDVNNFYFQYARESKRWKRIGSRVILFNLGNDFTLTACATAYGVRRPYLTAMPDGGVTENRANLNRYPLQAYGAHFIEKYRDYDSLIADPGSDWANVYPEALIEIPLSRFLIERLHPLRAKLENSLSKRLCGLPLRGELDYEYPRWLLLRQEKWPEPFTAFANDFRSILAAVKAQNSELSIILFPMPAQVAAEKYDEAIGYLQNRGYGEADLDRFSFNKYLRGLCNELGIELIDLTPEIVVSPDPGSWFFKGDPHLNPQGIANCARIFLRDSARFRPAAPAP